MRLLVKLRSAKIESTRNGFLSIDGSMKKDDAKSFLYYFMKHNPWAWEYLMKVRQRFDDRGIE